MISRERCALAALVMAILSCGDDAPPASIDSGTPPRDGGPGIDSGPRPDAGGVGGAAFRGEVFFTEGFEDSDFAGRGWYDESTAVLSDVEHQVGARSFECRFAPGETTCPGRPGRHMFPQAESVYLSFWVKYSTSWVGSGRPYHPHEFHFITNQDGMYVGPARTHLTTYTEQVDLVPRLAIQDGLNVDTGCILRNDDSIVGCGGDFASYPFTEMRSVASCNGLSGDVDGRDCFDSGGGNWYSARFWDARAAGFTRGTWHFVESYWRMNTIAGGIGQIDGAVRYWVDGALLITYDRILMRTGQHPDMRFNQFLTAQYIGDGSPVDQTVWIDELTVARGVP